MPSVERLRASHPESQLAILGINSDGSKSTAQAFLRRNPHHWPNVHAWSQRQNPINLYGVKLLPTFFVIDQIGNIQYRGNNIGTASRKVAELIANPSLPADYASAPVVSLR